MRKQIDPDRRVAIGRERRSRTRARIVAAAFALLGDEAGLYARIEDIAAQAGVTRATFYNHFASMADLREALTFEVTHDFLEAVTRAIRRIPDARIRSSCAVRFYLQRAAADRRWGWSMIHLSASGLIFGAETFGQAEQTIREGLADGVFGIATAAVGRDLLLGTTLAAMGSIVRGGVAEDHAASIATLILLGLGVSPEEAASCAAQPLPAFPPVDPIDSPPDTD